MAGGLPVEGAGAQPPQTAVSGAPGEPRKPPEYIVNLDRLNVPEETKQFIQENAQPIAEKLQDLTGKPVTFDDVVEAAKTAEVLKHGTSRDETIKLEAQILRTRQHLSALANKKEVSKEYVDMLVLLRSAQTNAARILGSQAINADPIWKQEMDKIIQRIIDSGAKVDDIIERAKGVDFENPQEALKFYREFIKPTLGEILNEYRYINLLSSPLTHIVNAASNLVQVMGLRPAVMLYSGMIDPIASSLTGKERSHYVNEIPAYVRGALSGLPEAYSQALAALSGKRYIERPQVPRMASGVKFLDTFQIIPRALEAMDVFFRTLAYQGEIEALAKKGITGPKAQDLAMRKAAYSIFRSEVDPANKGGQGYLLSDITR
jgi:hypothetical protein